MNTGIIGSGNVATVFGEKMASAGHEICQVVARRAEPAAALAAVLGCPWTTDPGQTDTAADLYLVALSDAALPDLHETLSLPGKLVVHTAGSASVGTLAGVSGRCGVVWPVQSIRAEVRPQPPMPLLIDALLPADLPILSAFARSLSPVVEYAADAARQRLHLAATIVNNFTNYLYTLVSGYCRQENLDFTLLLPLIRETAERLDRYPAETTQTGPAARGDRPTIGRHLKLLDKYEKIKLLYELFSIQIEEYYHYER